AAAGVRPLSQAAQMEPAEPVESEPDVWLAARLQERRPLLARVLAAEGGQGGPAALDGLRLARAPRLVVHYRLETPGRVYTTAPEAVAAIFVAEEKTLYTVHDQENVPWAAIGRILAAQMKPAGPIGGLAGGIKEALASSSAAEAGRVLDELGYPG
ncbi:MAG: hypothetical protein L0322_21235, partial [Chloroflexi bacterium]|nr:hypothetical protein [Chloroflexota bacterium]